MAPVIRCPCCSHDGMRGPYVVLHGHLSNGRMESVKDSRSGPVGQYQTVHKLLEGKCAWFPLG
eukprot:3142621-Amphidinium_carterae.1